MHRVSSNFTLFFKLFLPTSWIVFFGTFTVALFLIDQGQLPFLTSPYFKYPFLGVFLFFLFLLYISIIQLKRVELGDDSYYVSNYLKTFRLVYEDIDSIDMINLGRLKWITFKLKSTGSFGLKIKFLASSQLYQIFMDDHPSVASMLKEKVKI